MPDLAMLQAARQRFNANPYKPRPPIQNPQTPGQTATGQTQSALGPQPPPDSAGPQPSPNAPGVPTGRGASANPAADAAQQRAQGAAGTLAGSVSQGVGAPPPAAPPGPPASREAQAQQQSLRDLYGKAKETQGDTQGLTTDTEGDQSVQQRAAGSSLAGMGDVYGGSTGDVTRNWSIPEKKNEVPIDEGDQHVEGDFEGQGRVERRTGDPMVREQESDTRENRATSGDSSGRFGRIGDIIRETGAERSDQAQDAYDALTDEEKQAIADREQFEKETEGWDEARKRLWSETMGEDQMSEAEREGKIAAAKERYNALQEKMNRAQGAVGGESMAQVIGAAANEYGLGQAQADILGQEYDRKVQEREMAARLLEEQAARQERESSLFQTAQDYFEERGWILTGDGRVLRSDGTEVKPQDMSPEDRRALEAFKYGGGGETGGGDSEPGSDKQFTGQERATVSTPEEARKTAKEKWHATDEQADELARLIAEGKYDEADALAAKLKATGKKIDDEAAKPAEDLPGGWLNPFNWNIG